jgi:hypothetical protein
LIAISDFGMEKMTVFLSGGLESRSVTSSASVSGSNLAIGADIDGEGFVIASAGALTITNTIDAGLESNAALAVRNIGADC